MPDPRGIPSLNAFIDSLESAQHGDYAARSDSRVAHEAAFSEMRSYILELYRDVSASHSFMDEYGGIFDCIPIEQQPALRGSTESIPEAPDLPTVPSGDEVDQRDYARGSPLSPDRTDSYGNAMNCPDGTIPVRRVTLEDLTRFETLRDFFRKGPRGASRRPPREAEPATVPVTH